MKREHILLIICIIVMIALSLNSYTKSLKYDCNQCNIVLKERTINYRDSGLEYDNVMNVSINILYSGLYYGECPLSWDNINGYVKT